MKVKVGFITSWRRAMFFSLVGFILIFGFARSISTALLGINTVTTIISLAAFFAGAALFIYVTFGAKARFEGEGEISEANGVFRYKDKKRHFDVRMADIKKIDIQPMTFRKQGGNPLAYEVIIVAGNKKYLIESEFADGLEYNEVSLYKLYIFLQEKNNERA